MRRTPPITAALAATLALGGQALAGDAVHHARGSFEVSLKPQETTAADGLTLGRMTMDKTFRGGLEATSQGQMLTVMTATPGSAVYVATERVTGTLDGKPGGFALAHRGAMRAGQQDLSVEIVPDSGFGALKGVTGQLTITIVDGKHLYDLEYSLPQ